MMGRHPSLDSALRSIAFFKFCYLKLIFIVKSKAECINLKITALLLRVIWGYLWNELYINFSVLITSLFSFSNIC